MSFSANLSVEGRSLPLSFFKNEKENMYSVIADGRHYILESPGKFKELSKQIIGDAFTDIKKKHDIQKTTYGSFSKKKDQYRYVLEGVSSFAGKKFVLQTEVKNAKSLKNVSKALKSDKEFALMVVAKYGCALEFFNSKLQRDDDVAMVALKQNPYAFGYAKELQGCRSFVEKAVAQNGLTYEFVTGELKFDKEIIRIAVKQNPMAFVYVPISLQRDINFVEELVSINGLVLEYVRKKFKKDLKIILKAISNDGAALPYVGGKWRYCKRIVQQAIEQCPMALEFADKETLRDKNILLKAISRDEKTFNFVPKGIRSKVGFIFEALELNGLVYMMLQDNLKSIEMEKVAKNALMHSFKALKGKEDSDVELWKKIKRLKELAPLWTSEIEIALKLKAFSKDLIQQLSLNNEARPIVHLSFK